MKIMLKVVGWVLVFFGFLAFIGAAGGGNPIAGFFLLGVFSLPLLYLDRDLRKQISGIKERYFPTNKNKTSDINDGSKKSEEKQKLPELSEDEIEYIQALILKADPLFSITHKTKKVILCNYNKKEQKADFGSACCLSCLFLPLGILYAILGGAKGTTDQISLEIDDDNYFILEGKHVHKSKIIKQIKKSKFSNRLG